MKVLLIGVLLFSQSVLADHDPYRLAVKETNAKFSISSSSLYSTHLKYFKSTDKDPEYDLMIKKISHTMYFAFLGYDTREVDQKLCNEQCSTLGNSAFRKKLMSYKIVSESKATLRCQNLCTTHFALYNGYKRGKADELVKPLSLVRQKIKRKNKGV